MSSDSSTVNELLLQILLRLGRIEEQLERGALEDMVSELLEGMRRVERSSRDLSERVSRIERAAGQPLNGTIGDGTADNQHSGIVHTIHRDTDPPVPPASHRMPQRVRKSTSSITTEPEAESSEPEN
jgi:hypothetical protein